MAVVIWTRKANDARYRALEYGTVTFGAAAVDKMNHRIEHCVRLLATNPHIGAIEQTLRNRRYEYRSLVVHRYFKIVYYIDALHEKIYITAFWDVRQEPQRLTQETKEERIKT